MASWIPYFKSGSRRRCRCWFTDFLTTKYTEHTKGAQTGLAGQFSVSGFRIVRVFRGKSLRGAGGGAGAVIDAKAGSYRFGQGAIPSQEKCLMPRPCLANWTTQPSHRRFVFETGCARSAFLWLTESSKSPVHQVGCGVTMQVPLCLPVNHTAPICGRRRCDSFGGKNTESSD